MAALTTPQKPNALPPPKLELYSEETPQQIQAQSQQANAYNAAHGVPQPSTLSQPIQVTPHQVGSFELPTPTPQPIQVTPHQVGSFELPTPTPQPIQVYPGAPMIPGVPQPSIGTPTLYPGAPAIPFTRPQQLPTTVTPTTTAATPPPSAHPAWQGWKGEGKYYFPAAGQTSADAKYYANVQQLSEANEDLFNKPYVNVPTGQTIQVPLEPELKEELVTSVKAGQPLEPFTKNPLRKQYA